MVFLDLLFRWMRASRWIRSAGCGMNTRGRLFPAPLSSVGQGGGRGAEGGSPGGGFTAAPPDVCRNEEDSEDESLSHGGRQNHDNLYRVHMPSLYSCGSSYGSETSIPAAAHTVSNAPVTEYL